MYLASSTPHDWGEYFYLRLPKIYRDYDAYQQFQLERYLTSLIEGGYVPLLSETELLDTLIDPDKCPEEYLPLLCETFGIKYFEDIPSIYQRRFLRSITHLYQRKGTESAISYIARELSGLSVTVDFVDGEYRIRLNAFEENAPKLLLEQDIISRYVEMFIPVNVTARVVTTYTFLDGKTLATEEQEMIFAIYDAMIQEIEGSYEKFTKNTNGDNETGIDINIGAIEDQYTPFSEKSSITNVAVIGLNFHTNVINGIDTIDTSGVEEVILY